MILSLYFRVLWFVTKCLLVTVSMVIIAGLAYAVASYVHYRQHPHTLDSSGHHKVVEDYLNLLERSKTERKGLLDD